MGPASRRSALASVTSRIRNTGIAAQKCFLCRGGGAWNVACTWKRNSFTNGLYVTARAKTYVFAKFTILIQPPTAPFHYFRTTNVWHAENRVGKDIGLKIGITGWRRHLALLRWTPSAGHSEGPVTITISAEKATAGRQPERRAAIGGIEWGGAGCTLKQHLRPLGGHSTPLSKKGGHFHQPK